MTIKMGLKLDNSPEAALADQTRKSEEVRVPPAVYLKPISVAWLARRVAYFGKQ